MYLWFQALNTKEDNQVVTPRQIEELRTEVTSLKGLLINRYGVYYLKTSFYCCK